MSTALFQSGIKRRLSSEFRVAKLNCFLFTFYTFIYTEGQDSSISKKLGSGLIAGGVFFWYRPLASHSFQIKFSLAAGASH